MSDNPGVHSKWVKRLAKWCEDRKFTVVDGCWVWHRMDSYQGYSTVKGKHRAVYELFHGAKVPRGYVVHHKCENKRCVNPAHLEAVTASQHMLLHPNRKRK